ncbi:MAG: N-acetylglucosamine-6-phosphate deacetylase [Lachnospiraceae bacterium]|nr:N-acetylglucosamine-6-phosphate deacetylase [Lachnospiraceae bacterium]
MIIKGAAVFNPEGTFEKKDLYIENDTFAHSAASESTVLDADGLYAIPGLTDVHFHGCAGYDFCDGTEEAIQAIADYELANGVTSMVPATMTYGEEKLTEIAKAAKAHRNEKGARLLGINMEGPFISMEKKGAQNPAYIHTPDIDMFRRIQAASGNLVKLVDIAPEEAHSMDFIEELKDEVGISIAHTTADYETASLALEKGARQITHLYNAMPPFSHRAPGVIGAAFDHPHTRVELICDGIHIHPSVVRATFQLFGDDRVILISDSMMATGLEDGDYALGGQAVKVTGPRATLADGTIAGSATNLLNCLRTAVLRMNVPLKSAVKAAAVNSAKAAGIYDHYGSIETGKAADLLLLDKDLQLVHIIQGGKVITPRS